MQQGSLSHLPSPRSAGVPASTLHELGNDALFHFGWEALAHPAERFHHPREVVGDPRLSCDEKRAILASWASDACAVAPALRMPPGAAEPVLFDDVMEALRAVDQEGVETLMPS